MRCPPLIIPLMIQLFRKLAFIHTYSLYIYIHIIYIFKYIHIYIYMYIVYTNEYKYSYIHTYQYIHIYIYTYIYIYMYVRVKAQLSSTWLYFKWWLEDTLDIMFHKRSKGPEKNKHSAGARGLRETWVLLWWTSMPKKSLVSAQEESWNVFETRNCE